jgi:thioredoxin 2
MAESKIIIPCPHCDTQNRLPAERRGQGKCGTCHHPLFAGKPLALTMSRFDRHSGAADLPLLVDFWAQWCGPCRAMAPAFEAAAKEFEPHLRLAKVDTDAEPELAARYRIQSIPTLILFRDGRETARQSGAMQNSALRQWIARHIGDAASAA